MDKLEVKERVRSSHVVESEHLKFAHDRQRAATNSTPWMYHRSNLLWFIRVSLYKSLLSSAIPNYDRGLELAFRRLDRKFLSSDYSKASAKELDEAVEEFLAEAEGIAGGNLGLLSVQYKCFLRGLKLYRAVHRQCIESMTPEHMQLEELHKLAVTVVYRYSDDDLAPLAVTEKRFEGISEARWRVHWDWNAENLNAYLECYDDLMKDAIYHDWAESVNYLWARSLDYSLPEDPLSLQEELRSSLEVSLLWLKGYNEASPGGLNDLEELKKLRLTLEVDQLWLSCEAAEEGDGNS